jgi:hypothetical protein
MSLQILAQIFALRLRNCDQFADFGTDCCEIAISLQKISAQSLQNGEFLAIICTVSCRGCEIANSLRLFAHFLKQCQFGSANFSPYRLVALSVKFSFLLFLSQLFLVVVVVVVKLFLGGGG